jgi:hypothetical protein
MLCAQQTDQYDLLLDRRLNGVPASLLGELRTSAGVSAPYCPERTLLEAVLREAILCASGQGEPARERARLAAEARRWMMSRSRNWLFAFESICDVLNINADCLRRQLFAPAHAPVTARNGQPVASASPAPGDIVQRLRIVRMRGNRRPRKLYRRRVRRSR